MIQDRRRILIRRVEEYRTTVEENVTKHLQRVTDLRRILGGRRRV